MNLNVHFLKDKEIEEQAEHFRTEYYGDALPFNPEGVWDWVLGKNIIPVQNLKRHTGVEAALTTNFNDMLVDREALQLRKYPGRLAFSISHELGHYHLHKECLSQLRLSSVGVWKAYFESVHPKIYYRMEYQADKFATFLMMPGVAVTAEATKLLTYLLSESTIKDKCDLADSGFRRYFSSLLADQFNVSVQAMEIRLKELGLLSDL